MKFFRIVWANLVRKKVRLSLTIGSFAIALLLFAILGVVREAFGRTDLASADRLIIINRTSIINPVPLSYRDKILHIPGVKSITHLCEGPPGRHRWPAHHGTVSLENR